MTTPAASRGNSFSSTAVALGFGMNADRDGHYLNLIPGHELTDVSGVMAVRRS